MNCCGSKNKAYGLFALVTLSFLGLSACLEFRKEKLVSEAQVDASFASLRDNLLIPKCVSCHSGANSPHGIDLSTYSSIMHGPVFPPLVIPGKPEESSLYQSCETGSMPKGAPHLSAAMLGALREWIRNGAKEFDDPNPSPSSTPTEPGDEPGENDEPGTEPGDDEPGSEEGDGREEESGASDTADETDGPGGK